MRTPLITLCLLIGLLITLSTAARTANETESSEDLHFSEIESDNDPQEVHKKRDSGYNYDRPIRYNRPHFRSRSRTRLSKYRNQLNRPFNLYGPPKTQEPNIQQLNTQYHEPSKTPNNVQQGVPEPVKTQNFAEPDPVPEQNDIPFLLETAKYLPPRNQKLPTQSASNVFSGDDRNQQIQSQNLIQKYLQDNRISDAALFLTQNAKMLSQLYGAPAPNQEYAPNNEYLDQLSNQQHNHLNPQVENVSGSQVPQEFPGPLPSYASGVLNPQVTLQSIQSQEKDRLIAQLRLALERQAHNQFQVSVPLGRNAPIFGNVNPGNEATNLENQQLVSPSVLGGERTTFGDVSFLSGSAISPSGFKVTYGVPTSSQVPATAAPSPIRPQGASVPVGSSGSVGTGIVVPATGSVVPGSFTPNFPQYGTYIPTLIPGTNFVASVPALGSGFLGSSFVPAPSHPTSSSPNHFGIPIPGFPDQKPVFDNPTLTVPSKPGVGGSSLGHPINSPVHPVVTPVQPIHPVAHPIHPVAHPIHPVAHPIHPVASPVHPVSNPSHPVQPVRPVTAPAYPEVTPAYPTYGLQSNFLNSLFIKPLKPVIPVYYYPNVPLQIPKPTLTTHPWNYPSTIPQSKPNWK